MPDVMGVYEVAVRVKDRATAESFYTDVLGFEVGLRDETRDWVFLRAGGVAGMVVLTPDPEPFPKQHFAFAVATRQDLDGAAQELAARGVTVRGPVHHDWMGADSLYFSDPDGHDLELVHVVKANPHRRFAVQTFNDTWGWLDRTDRTPDDDYAMLLSAIASRYHWGKAGNDTNRAVGEWQISRVCAALGDTASAVAHGRRGLELAEAAGLPPFYVGFAHESLARAYAATQPDKARKHLAAAQAAAERIEDEDERKLLVDDLDGIEV